MGKLICEVCGGDTLMKQEDHFRCVTCGACYSPEHLKAMQEAPVPEVQPEEPQYEAAAIPVETPAPEEVEKPKANWKKIGKLAGRILLAAALIVLVGSLLIDGMIDNGVLPNKEQAKSCVKSDLERRFSNYRDTDPDITLGAIYVDEVEAVKFKTREEDPVGYFAHLAKPIPFTDRNGTEHESILAYLESKYEDYDPEAGDKWAYIITGTYEATHKAHGSLPGEFRYTYVYDIAENCWYYIEGEYGTSLDLVREEVKNQVIAQVLLQYEVQHNVKVQITSIDREYDIYDYYTVYGKVTAKDKYGDEYTGKFSAKYKYDSYHHIYEQESLEVDALRKEK